MHFSRIVFPFFGLCYLVVVTGNIILIIIDKTSFCSWHLFELYYLTTFFSLILMLVKLILKICFPVAVLEEDPFFGASKTAKEICLALKEER